MTQHIEIPQQFNDNELDALRRAARDRCDEIAVRLLGNPSSINRVEMRWGAHGSKALCLCGDRRGLWYCFEGAEGGNIIDLVMETEGCSFREAAAWLVAELAMPRIEGPWRVRSYRQDDDRDEKIFRAREYYAAARVAGEHGRRYFEGRGLDWLPDIGRQLRIADMRIPGEGNVPTLLMPMRDFSTHEITAVHGITIDCTDASGRRVKRSHGAVKGSAMMIAAPGQSIARLAVCEGLETGVGAIMGGLHEGGPMWALSGASFFDALEPLSGVGRLILCADPDPAGLKAVQRCQRRWREAAEVVMHWPDREGDDWADIHRRW